MEILHMLEPRKLITAFGFIGLLVIVYAESGLFFGFFLPGDSLLFTAGIVASQGDLNLMALLIGLSIAAILGDGTGYWYGKRFGRRLFQREDSFWFHRKHLERAHDFYEKHGGKAIVLARFLPIVRTFVPIVAGMALMTYPKFLFYNVIGGIGWVVSMVVGGYLFGNIIGENVDKYLLPVLVLIIVLSVAPTGWHLYKENRDLIHDWLKSRLKSKSGKK
jgi:membrane-associated protein